MAPALTTIFAGATCLTASEQSPDLRTTLLNRLSRYYEFRGSKPRDLQKLSLQDLQTLTAEEALNIVSDIQEVLCQDSHTENREPDVSTLLGTRDLAQLRTLISIVFKWGVEPLLSDCLQAWPNKLGEGPRLTAPESIWKQYDALARFTDHLITTIFLSGSGGALPSTHVTETIINSHLVDLLKPCLALGWLPKSLSSGSIVARDSLRPATLRLLTVLPPSQAIAALGGVLSSKQTPSLHMHRISTVLLGKQITRSHGVNGLFTAVFGEGVTEDDALLEKLEHIARVLLTVPQGSQPLDFYRSIVRQLLTLLSVNATSTYRRAAAFTVSRMLAADASQPHVEICSGLLLTCLHASFLQVQDASVNAESDGTHETQPANSLAPSTAVSTLSMLVSNMDPHPTSMSRLLSPIVPALYSLLYQLDKVRTSDPALRESAHALLITWGKIVDRPEGLDCIWLIYQSQEIHWSVGLDGIIRRAHKLEQMPTLSLFTPESIEDAEKSGSLDVDANIMDLYPDPVHYVRFLKELDRPDIASDLFVKLLESYRQQRLSSNADPLQTLLALQIIMQMQKQLSTGPSSSNLLCKPGHMLLFVKHVLESSLRERGKEKYPGAKPRTEIILQPSVELDEIEGVDEIADSDDEAGPEAASPDDEMVETAINLLLSILEANEDSSARTLPVLNDIYSLLEPVSRDAPTNIRAVAREARIVMTARLASTSVQQRTRSDDEESPQAIYQQALKFLQDPILPVRAHGLLLLRSLVTKSRQEVDSALIPAILSIFLQAVQDDESYLFLNAVQGLAAMVDSYGADVLKALIREYTDGLFNMGGSLSQHGLDIRVRVGEALGIVIRRVGTALGLYSDILVPPLFQVVHSAGVPTTLRTSSISLLADCVNTHALAIIPYVVDLTEAMIDLLQVETVPATDTSSKTQRGAECPADETTNKARSDSPPTSTNTKLPPLRRAALHFVSLLMRSMTEHVYEMSPTTVDVPSSTLKRAKTTLAYVASTDQDNVVRIMAREASEGLGQLQRAILGL